MKVDTMRFIDRYIGIPLCFVGTIIQKIFMRPTKKATPKNVLFIELSEMGSAILVDPAMEKVKTHYNCNIFFTIFRKNKPSLDLLKTVDNNNIFTIDASNMWGIIRDSIKYLYWTRKNKIDTVIDLELFSRYSGLLSGLSGADNIVAFNNFHGEGLYKGDMSTHKVHYNPHMHISKNFMSMVYALFSQEQEIPFSKVIIQDKDIILKKALIDNNAIEKVVSLIQDVCPEYKRGDKIILINPNASELLPQRRWAKDSYKELIHKIEQRYQDTYILITGAKSEEEDAIQLAKQCGSYCYSFAGKLDLLDLPALYSLSSIMVSNDSGPAHFASVTDMPTVVLFGPETPNLYKSLGKTIPIYKGLACSPCVSASNHRKTPCADNKCLQLITIDDVFNVVKDILDDK